MAYQKYTELECWKYAIYFASFIYKLTVDFPTSEQYGLVSQIRRCAVSIPSNIAEGSGRQHDKETIQFLSIARGSLYEIETQIYLSFDLGFLSDENLKECLDSVEILGKLINGYIRYLRGLSLKASNTAKQPINQTNQ